MDVDRVVRIGKALGNPHRVRILQLLIEKPYNVSQIARALELSRPVANMHLAKLVDAGFIIGEMELSEGNAMKNYRIDKLAVHLDTDDIAEGT